MTKGQCDYCKSTDGYWEDKGSWKCKTCGKSTQYFRLSELGKEVLDTLLPSIASIDSDSLRTKDK